MITPMKYTFIVEIEPQMSIWSALKMRLVGRGLPTVLLDMIKVQVTGNLSEMSGMVMRDIAKATVEQVVAEFKKQMEQSSQTTH